MGIGARDIAGNDVHDLFELYETVDEALEAM